MHFKQLLICHLLGVISLSGVSASLSTVEEIEQMDRTTLENRHVQIMDELEQLSKETKDDEPVSKKTTQQVLAKAKFLMMENDLVEDRLKTLDQGSAEEVGQGEQPTEEKLESGTRDEAVKSGSIAVPEVEESVIDTPEQKEGNEEKEQLQNVNENSGSLQLPEEEVEKDTNEPKEGFLSKYFGTKSEPVESQETDKSTLEMKEERIAEEKQEDHINKDTVDKVDEIQEKEKEEQEIRTGSISISVDDEYVKDEKDIQQVNKQSLPEKEDNEEEVRSLWPSFGNKEEPKKQMETGAQQEQEADSEENLETTPVIEKEEKPVEIVPELKKEDFLKSDGPTPQKTDLTTQTQSDAEVIPESEGSSSWYIAFTVLAMAALCSSRDQKQKKEPLSGTKSQELDPVANRSEGTYQHWALNEVDGNEIKC